MRTRFRPNAQLVARMSVTMFLLGLLYVGFAVALIVLLKSLALIIVILAALLVVQYWYSDKIALAALHGHEVSEAEAPQVHAIVDRLCASADLPKPRVAIADLDMPNAFATGRNAKHAVVCVSTGLIRRLDEPELEGVIAHELTHVAHRDVVVITVASFLGVLAGLLMRAALFSQLFGGRQRDQNTVLIFAAIAAVSAAVYAISYVLIRTLSRYRELAADHDGALLTGRPSALASALVKVSGEQSRIPSRDLRGAQAFNAFFFSPVGAQWTLFSTHPSLQRRLEELEKIAAQLGDQNWSLPRS
ncbi:zinc metalloprotease HtpX [Actinospica robiniae]|uniref:zinc metalloprotease HtpX n=1 Tax=Actinospica robiniae TaxID=304901 RepID=UPI0003F87213|nr:zinc metalloprotease HtpX [Actinospica robiniae]